MKHKRGEEKGDDTRGEQTFIHPPARAAGAALRSYRRIAAAPVRLEWGAKSLDEYIIPMSAGDMVSIMGRPGHGKTSLMLHLARRASRVCDELARLGKGKDREVIFVTWETTIEEFMALLTVEESGQSLESIGRGTADLERIEAACIKSLANRVTIIGRSEDTPPGMRLDLPLVARLISHIRKSGRDPIAIFFDYLQRIPSPAPRMDMMARVMENTELVKDIGLGFHCPTIVGVQASRRVDDQTGLQFAGLNDAQWASTIEQTTDKLIALTRPILYLKEGHILELRGQEHPVTQNLMGLRVLKQRWARAGKTFLVHFDPSTILLSDLATGEPDGVQIPF